MIKRKLISKLLESGLAKEMDVIEHSYTDGGTRDMNKIIVSRNGIVPSFTTRPDTLGVVVDGRKTKKL